MSGRQQLVGHNFIAFDSAKTVLVPVGGYEEGMGESCLRFCGMAPAPGERVVVSEPHDGIIAIMAVPNSAWEAAGRQAGEKFRVTSPLLEIATGQGREVNILMTDENVYLAVWEKGLKMAEVLPDNSVDSLLYYMQVVGRRFRLKKFDINVAGTRAGIAADALRHYFRNVKVRP